MAEEEADGAGNDAEDGDAEEEVAKAEPEAEPAAAEDVAPAEEAAPAEAASADYDSMTVAELKELLKAAGKPVSGKNMMELLDDMYECLRIEDKEMGDGPDDTSRSGSKHIRALELNVLRCEELKKTGKADRERQKILNIWLPLNAVHEKVAEKRAADLWAAPGSSPRVVSGALGAAVEPHGVAAFALEAAE